MVNQWLAILDAPESQFKHYYYNTGADTIKISDLVDIVQSLLPEAEIEVNYSSEKNVGGIISQVSDQNIREELGITRRFSPIKLGIEAMIEEIKKERYGNN